jgi:hypothetical protein
MTVLTQVAVVRIDWAGGFLLNLIVIITVVLIFTYDKIRGHRVGDTLLRSLRTHDAYWFTRRSP